MQLSNAVSKVCATSVQESKINKVRLLSLEVLKHQQKCTGDDFSS